MKLNIHEFQGTDKEPTEKRVIVRLLEKLYPDLILEWTSLEDCDFIYTNNEAFLNHSNNFSKKYIFWCGEPYCSMPKENAPKHLFFLTNIQVTQMIRNSIYLPYCLYSNWLYKDRVEKNINRPYLLAYCSIHCNFVRESIFDLFVQKAGTELCHSYGFCNANHPETRREGAGQFWFDPALIECYKKYKFVIAIENTCADGYVTEKIMNAFYSGAIPIYRGSQNIMQLFNKKAFINVDDFASFEDCVDHVLQMDASEIKKMSEEPIYAADSEIIHLFDDEYNRQHGNQTLTTYLNKLKEFVETP